jgi:hypothetical protein
MIKDSNKKNRGQQDRQVSFVLSLLFSPSHSLSLLLLFLLFSFSASAAEKGPKSNTRSYPIDGTYQKLMATSGFDISFSDTAKAAIVTVPESVHKLVVVEVSKETLRLAIQGKVKLKERPTVVLPRNTQIKAIELTNGVSINAGKMTCEQLAIYLNDGASFRGEITAKLVSIAQAGASNFYGVFNADNIGLNLRGASKAELRGKCLKKLTLKLREASALDAEKLETRRIEGSLGSASNAVVWCTEQIHVPVDDASRLVYIGRPRIADCPTGAMSTVIRKQK